MSFLRDATPLPLGWGQGKREHRFPEPGLPVPGDRPVVMEAVLVLPFRMGDLHYGASCSKGTRNGFISGALWRH